MKNTITPQGYKSALSLRETQRAIKLTKDTVQVLLGASLNLDRVTAPLLVEAGRGINDDLNGTERKVIFSVRETGADAEVVQSLAKWKRIALRRYGYGHGEGIYTDMSAIRRDDDMDNLHSVYVDQWDWERVMKSDERNRDFLRELVKRIVSAIISTQQIVKKAYPVLQTILCEKVSFVTSEELLSMYPNLTAHEREVEYVKAHRTVFIEQIGGKLSDGSRHDGRAPDYDDWSLNGDLFFWDEILACPIEISSMGIRVDSTSLNAQLTESGCLDRMKYEYHRQIAEGELPLTVGGGIGQSRLCMLLLEKAHIGEIQSSVWDKETKEKCAAAGILLL